MLSDLRKDFEKLKDPKQAVLLSRFFKTGKGEYGEGDIFFGIKVPELRKLSKIYQDIYLGEAEELLSSRIHEHRMTALFIIIEKYQKADDALKKRIFTLYLKNTEHINNWDLVDLSAPNIVGDYLLSRDRKILYRLAKSKSLWERRIAIMSTFMFIRNKDFKDAFAIAEILLKDEHDLIHKAVGWMLREIGKRDIKTEEIFLKKYSKNMPRTMLRYAIEKFSKSRRGFYMKR